MSRCDHTAPMLDRIVAEEGLSPADAGHLRECAICQGAVRRFRTFDTELQAAARSLATEPMPLRVTDPALNVRSPGGFGGAVAFAGIAAALVVALLLGGQLRGLNPQLGSVVTPPPTVLFRAESAIAMDLAAGGYDCGDDIIDPKASPPLRGLVCVPPMTAQLMGAIALERSPDGAVRKVTAKAQPVDKMDGPFQLEATGLLDVAVTTAVGEGNTAAAVRSWLEPAVTDTHPGGSRALNIEGLHLQLARDRTGGYLLRVTQVR